MRPMVRVPAPEEILQAGEVWEALGVSQSSADRPVPRAGCWGPRLSAGCACDHCCACGGLCRRHCPQPLTLWPVQRPSSACLHAREARARSAEEAHVPADERSALPATAAPVALKPAHNSAPRSGCWLGTACKGCPPLASFLNPRPRAYYFSLPGRWLTGVVPRGSSRQDDRVEQHRED